MKTSNTMKPSMPHFLEVRHMGKRTFLEAAKIVHIDACSNYTRIHSEDHPPVMVAKVLKKYQQLLEGYGFMRINNSVLINAHHVREINEHGCIVMVDETIFYPSRRRKGELKKLFVNTLAS